MSKFIRPTLPEETATLVALAVSTGKFKDFEIVALREVLDDYHRVNASLGHRAATFVSEGQAIGFVYFAPAAMTDRAWYLYWIAVAVDRQGQGIGAELLAFAEREIRQAQGRLLLIETSGAPHYEATRGFYLKKGYEVGARLRDFYADGDDLVVFRRRLIGVDRGIPGVRTPQTEAN